MLTLRAEYNVTHAAIDCLSKGLEQIILQIHQQEDAGGVLERYTVSLRNLNSQRKRYNNLTKHFKFIKLQELQVKPS